MVNGQTSISGNIVENTRWTKSGSPYNVVGPTSVAEGIVLTIEAGVTVNCTSYLGIVVKGTIVASGVVGDSVYFNTVLFNKKRFNDSRSFHIQNKGSIKLNYCRQQGAFYFSKLERDVGNVSANHCVFADNEYTFFGKGGENILTLNNSFFFDTKYAVSALKLLANHCHFEGLQNVALNDIGNSIIKNCVFKKNARAIQVNAEFTLLDCIFEENPSAIFTESLNNRFVVKRNTFNGNGVALSFTGKAGGADTIYNNTFCNNSNFDIDNPILNDVKLNLKDNCWCEDDTAKVMARISKPDKAVVYPFHISCRPCEAVIKNPALNIVCSGKPLPLLGKDMPGMTMQWLPQERLAVTSGNTSSFQYNNPTEDTAFFTTYYRVINPANNCSANDSVRIGVLPAAAAQCRECRFLLPMDTMKICPDKPIGLGWETPRPFITYQWTPAEGIENVSSHNPIFQLNNSSESNVWKKYIVRLTDVEANCTSTDSLYVQLLPLFSNTCNLRPELHVYNVITPNNDFKNETLYIENYQYYKNLAIRIFNKWGQEVYYNRDYKCDWSGGNLPSGTYYYHLINEELNQELRGSFLLAKSD